MMTHDDVQNWCLCLKEWGNCLLHTVTCYVLVSSPHYFFFKLHVLYPFLHILNLSLTFAHYLLLPCGWVGSLWMKSWNSMYENNKQFIIPTVARCDRIAACVRPSPPLSNKHAIQSLITIAYHADMNIIPAWNEQCPQPHNILRLCDAL